MRIRFTKISDERHVLEVVREDGRWESVECETRSYLMHDLLHYAVESEARLERGFWGLLAGGKTLAEMNDRTGRAMAPAAPGLMIVEQAVGLLSNVAKGRPTAEIVAALRNFAAARDQAALAWVTPSFIEAVRERMRALVGHWKATPYRATMELPWPSDAAP